MEAFNYLYDQSGNKTAMLVDLSNPNNESILKQPLNKAQLALLQMVSVINNEQVLDELSQLLAKFLAEKILDEGDKIWDERNYSGETFENLLKND